MAIRVAIYLVDATRDGAFKTVRADAGLAQKASDIIFKNLHLATSRPILPSLPCPISSSGV